MLRFGSEKSKEKLVFLWFFTRLAVTLQAKKE